MVDAVNLTPEVDVVNLIGKAAAMESRKDALVAAATALLDKGGPDAVTLREVGRAAGVSHNAPYKHFADKEELLAAVAAADLARQTQIVSSGPPRSLRELMQGYARAALRHPERFQLTFGRWGRDDAGLGEAALHAHENLLGAVVAAQEAAELPKGDPERLAALVRALAHGAADLALAGHLKAGGKGKANPADLIDDLFDYLAAAARRP